MSTPDLVLLAVIGVSALLGLMRGFIGVLASLLAWILAGWVAIRFGGQFALLLSDGAEPTATQVFGGYALSFVIVMVAVGMIGWLLRTLVKSIGLSGVDRALGFAAGAVRGGFVACLLVLLMGFTSMPREAGWRESQVIPMFMPGAQWLSGWLPHWAAARIDFGQGGALSSSSMPSSSPPPSLDGATALPAPAGV